MYIPGTTAFHHGLVSALNVTFKALGMEMVA